MLENKYSTDQKVINIQNFEEFPKMFKHYRVFDLGCVT